MNLIIMYNSNPWSPSEDNHPGYHSGTSENVGYNSNDMQNPQNMYGGNPVKDESVLKIKYQESNNGNDNPKKNNDKPESEFDHLVEEQHRPYQQNENNNLNHQTNLKDSSHFFLNEELMKQQQERILKKQKINNTKINNNTKSLKEETIDEAIERATSP
jgi:hypothetical protein